MVFMKYNRENASKQQLQTRLLQRNRDVHHRNALLLKKSPGLAGGQLGALKDLHVRHVLDHCPGIGYPNPELQEQAG